jgi:hypothetical protein
MADFIKALTLWQPWATLVAIGAKEYETRAWGTKYRGPIAIHAARNRNWRETGRYFGMEPFKSVLIEAGYLNFGDLPFGSVVAVGELTAIYRAEKLEPKISEVERSFGDYRPRRYAWRIRNVRRLENPILAQGARGLWWWNREGGGYRCPPLAIISPVERAIVEAVHELQRYHAHVWPWLVQDYLPVRLSERQVRRYMARLAAYGALDRVGQRRGYRCPLARTA